MKRILLLTLGTGKGSKEAVGEEIATQIPDNKTFFQVYQKADYLEEGFQKEATLIAEPLTRITKPDIVVFIGTVRSAWVSVYSEFVPDELRSPDDIRKLIHIQSLLRKDTDEQTIAKMEQEIQSIFDRAQLQKSFLPDREITVKVLLIKYGLTEEELLYNYHKISENALSVIDPKETYEVSFDITHSFRSIPIYNLAILNYLKNLSKADIRIAHVFYGCYEAKEENDGNVPIVDLSDIVSVMDLTSAVAEFKATGATTELQEYLPETRNDLRQSLHRFEWATEINNFDMMIEETENLLKMSHDGETRRYADVLEMIQDALQEGFLRGHTLQDFLAMSSAKKRLCISKWYMDQTRYGFAVATLIEAFKSVTVRLYLEYKPAINTGEAPTRSDKNRKDSIQRFTQVATFIRRECQNPDPIEDLYERISRSYLRIIQIRNMFAHNLHDAEDEGEKLNMGIVKNDIANFFTMIERFIKEDEEHHDKMLEVYCKKLRPEELTVVTLQEKPLKVIVYHKSQDQEGDKEILSAACKKQHRSSGGKEYDIYALPIGKTWDNYHEWGSFLKESGVPEHAIICFQKIGIPTMLKAIPYYVESGFASFRMLNADGTSAGDFDKSAIENWINMEAVSEEQPQTFFWDKMKLKKL